MSTEIIEDELSLMVSVVKVMKLVSARGEAVATLTKVNRAYECKLLGGVLKIEWEFDGRSDV